MSELGSARDNQQTGLTHVGSHRLRRRGTVTTTTGKLATPSRNVTVWWRVLLDGGDGWLPLTGIDSRGSASYELQGLK